MNFLLSAKKKYVQSLVCAIKKVLPPNLGCSTTLFYHKNIFKVKADIARCSNRFCVVLGKRRACQYDLFPNFS